MLFDLRGRGRRRTIQGIYLFLAVLMGGGLVFFGIGGGSGGGGLLDAVNQGGGGKANGLNIYAKQAKAAEAQVAVAPGNRAAWASLAHTRFLIAGLGDDYNQTTRTFTSKGRGQLEAAQQAWERYLALKPPTPNPNLAREMVRALAALNQLDAAVTAQEIVAVHDAGNSAQFANLAAMAYLAGQQRKGDLASAKAVSLAAKNVAPTLKQYLTSLRTGIKSPAGQQVAQQLGVGSAS
jgi:hypothetical protein